MNCDGIVFVTNIKRGPNFELKIGYHEHRGKVFLDLIPFVMDRETGRPTARLGVSVPASQIQELIDSIRIAESKALELV